MRKYVLDTNLYVRAFRSEQAAGELEHFYTAWTPQSYLSSIVLHELLVGTTTSAKADEVREEIAGPFKRVGRIITPSHAAWEAAGEALAEMAREEKVELRRVPKSLVHDFLLAASCRELGVVIVTDNTSDFERIGRYIDVTFSAPWPS